MPTTPETQPTPHWTNNPYQHPKQRHPTQSPGQHPSTETQTKPFNFIHWLSTARTTPQTSPNYEPETENSTNRRQQQQKQRQRNNTRNQQTHLPTPTITPATQTQPITQTTIEQRDTIQTALNLPLDNIHWGDQLHPVPETTFRILSKNVNSLSTNEHFVQWRAAAAAAQESNTNVLCLQETNLRWENNNHQAIQQIFRKSHEAAKISVSSSNEPSANEYQPGGTFIAALGPWTSRVWQAASDSTGLGRWSYLTF